MPRGTTLLVAGLAALAGCSKSSEQKTPPASSAAVASALARPTAIPAPSGFLALSPEESAEDERITDPDALIARGWERHRGAKDARAHFARAGELLKAASPSQPSGSGKGPGPIEGLATSTEGITAAVKVARGVLFFRPSTGTITGWREVPGTLAPRSGIAFHPVRPLLTVVVQGPVAVRIIDARSLAELPVPAVDEAFVPAVSPSGTRLAYWRDKALHILDVDAGKDRYAPLPQPDGTLPGAVLFAPDTRTFAVVDVSESVRGPHNARLRLVDATDGRVVLNRAIERTYDGGAVPPAEDPPAMDFGADATTFRF
ncbi:MAG: hypothetical protein EOO75_17465, partial [Myxococcales bacterium]